VSQPLRFDASYDKSAYRAFGLAGQRSQSIVHFEFSPAFRLTADGHLLAEIAYMPGTLPRSARLTGSTGLQQPLN